MRHTMGTVITVLIAIAAGSASAQEPGDIAAVSAQEQSHYWMIGLSADKTSLEYIDAASIAATAPETKSARIETFYSKESPLSAGGTAVELYDVNCQSKQIRGLQSKMYDSQGVLNANASDDRPGPWTNVTAGAFADSIVGFVCPDGPARNSLALDLGNMGPPDLHARYMFEKLSEPAPSSIAAAENQTNGTPQ